MDTQDLRTAPREGELRPEEYFARLQKLQRREWWTWGTSLGVMLLLTVGVASLSIPSILSSREGGGLSYSSGVFQSVVGLVSLILLFGAYLTYEKFLINRLRLELAEKQVHSTLWRNLALVDPLTGLYNRRFAERRLKSEMARAERRGYALTLVVFDLNSFKAINDRFGHAAGDAVLKEFGARLSKAVREMDLAARLGGDEFLVLLAECDASKIPTVLARLQSIEAEFEGKRIPVTFSVGWREYQRGQQPEELLDLADKALYSDKQSRKRERELAPSRA
jgi:diguanylate cyclase (GGDEF)-like protein